MGEVLGDNTLQNQTKRKSNSNLTTQNTSTILQDATFQLIAQPLPQQQLPTPTVLVPTQSLHHHTTPPFLSRFPRSISSLSLGTKKKSVEKENVVSPDNSHSSSGVAAAHQQQTPKKKISLTGGHDKNHKEKDIPPPLPQRNPPRKSTPGTDSIHSTQSPDDGVVLRRLGACGGAGSSGDVMVSDLDNSIGSPTGAQYNRFIANNSPVGSSAAASSSAGKSKKRPKTKTKALSDPKMSSQMFLEMECGGASRFSSEPPPLPPRQPGMMEELNLGKGPQAAKAGHMRPVPNSIETMLNYPLISTCTAVRDNKYNSSTTAFPLSNRPNIVQHLQQHQHLSPYKSATSTATAKNSTVSNFFLSFSQQNQKKKQKTCIKKRR